MMLLVLTLLAGWLVVMLLLAAACRMAARADRDQQLAERLDRELDPGNQPTLW
jgi:hypothetical protein